MCHLNKFVETMTSRERVVRTFAFEKTDRVTIGYDANPGIDARLKKALGVADDNDEALMVVLGVDYRGIGARYVGPMLHVVPPERRVNQLEGSISRWIEHGTGGYWDACDFPLADADDEAFERFPVPNPDDFDYDAALDRAKSYHGQYALYIGNPGVPDVINSNGRIMGMEDVLCHLITGNQAAMDFIHRRVAFQFGMLERLLTKCKGHIDFLWLGEDLGTQIAPMISLELYRSTLKPIHKKFADLAAHFGIPAMMHTCGSSSWAYEDMIDIGIKAVDTLQPEAVNMSPAYLVEHFGGRLGFRGCISTAGELVNGTVDDVTTVCKNTMELMKTCRGYHFAPTHQIQDNTPVENVVAMYQAAHDYGRY
ncbi:MAG: hypothetical protein FWD61_05100 [Phycisphaerales bacterium]|nr:hypothetical protein [Phycisphaerales bacterium]